MDAWNNVLDEYCDSSVRCMDDTMFLMYVYMLSWMELYMCCIDHMSAVPVKNIYMYFCV